MLIFFMERFFYGARYKGCFFESCRGYRKFTLTVLAMEESWLFLFEVVELLNKLASQKGWIKSEEQRTRKNRWKGR